MIYFDTSYLVRCYVQEQGADVVRQLAAGEQSIACSELGRLELVAAFHRKLRENRINNSQFAAIMNQLALDDSNGLWTWLPLTSQLLHETAARVAALPASCFVRAADALHLSCAAANRISTIFSNDKHLLAAANHFGVRAENVI